MTLRLNKACQQHRKYNRCGGNRITTFPLPTGLSDMIHQCRPPWTLLSLSDASSAQGHNPVCRGRVVLDGIL